jgi:hypothetical protein
MRNMAFNTETGRRGAPVQVLAPVWTKLSPHVVSTRTQEALHLIDCGSHGTAIASLCFIRPVAEDEEIEIAVRPRQRAVRAGTP